MTLKDYQREFIEFAIAEDVLCFGEFTLKSGRQSPYFFNAGQFRTGGALARLGGFYAAALQDSGLSYNGLFGPAYKGIPLVTAMAIALAERHHSDIPYTFNRKEVKDHGEGGLLVGAPVKGDIVIVDDVITAGTAIREVMELLQNTEGKAVGVVVAIDRQERGKGDLSAIQEVEKEYGVSVISVIRLDDIIEYLVETGGYEQELNAISSYRQAYGIASQA